MIEQYKNLLSYESEQQYPVRKEWFKGFLSGNLLWPQNNIGIRFLTLASVLRDQPKNWQEFAQSKFTSEQEMLLGKVMSRAHRLREIPIVTNEFHKNGDLIITNYRLQELWSATKAYVYADILNYIDEDFKLEWNMTFSAPITLTAQNTKKIQDFFNADEELSRRTTLIKIVGGVAECLRTKEALNCASSYKEELLNNRNTFSPRAIEIRKQLKLILTEFLSQQYPNEAFDRLFWGM
ncbi:MAG: hypothetical protein KatS3mg089_0187 [Patescibacteria group bacterium]|nr:MAG: hypothetical protein KatS3mg089_0187 [Patescibacteria group bacterium]